jgi:TIR domain
VKSRRRASGPLDLLDSRRLPQGGWIWVLNGFSTRILLSWFHVLGLRNDVLADKIFINYRRAQNLKDAQLLKAELDKKFGGKRVFLDVRGIDGGANWLQTLERQVAASAAMIVLIGKESYTGSTEYKRGSRD